MTRIKTVSRYAGYVASIGTAKVVGVLITSLTFPYLVRRLGVNTYGIWSYVLAVFSFLGIVANPGLTTFTSQAVASRRKAAFDLIPDVLTLRAIGTLVALIILRIV